MVKNPAIGGWAKRHATNSRPLHQLYLDTGELITDWTKFSDVVGDYWEEILHDGDFNVSDTNWLHSFPHAPVVTPALIKDLAGKHD